MTGETPGRERRPADVEPATAGATLNLTQEMRCIAERPGVIGVTIRYDVPDAVNELRTRIPDGATSSRRGSSPARRTPGTSGTARRPRRA